MDALKAWDVANRLPQEPSEGRVYGKYRIGKADGSEIDPNAVYFVLRIDRGEESDPEQVEAARKGLEAYCDALPPRLASLANDLRYLVNNVRGAEALTRVAQAEDPRRP